MLTYNDPHLIVRFDGPKSAFESEGGPREQYLQNHLSKVVFISGSTAEDATSVDKQQFVWISDGFSDKYIDFSNNKSIGDIITYINSISVDGVPIELSDGKNGINFIGTNGIDVELDDEQNPQLPSNVPYRTIKIDGQGIKNEILDDNGKIHPSLIPQYIARGLMYGGTIENRANPSIDPTIPSRLLFLKPTAAYINKHNVPEGTSEIEITENDFVASEHEGEYFIVISGDKYWYPIFVWDEKTYDVGDWIISSGISWEKIDNSDTVTSVAGETGNISAIKLAEILSSDKAGEKKLATNAELTPINTELTSVQKSISDVQESISNVQGSISDINEIRNKANIGASAVRIVKINGKTESPNDDGVVDLGVISGGDGTHNALFYAGTITGALGISVNNNNYAKAQVNEVFEDKYGYTSKWHGIELEDGEWGKAAYLEPGEYKLICKGTYNIPGSATPLFVPITLRINDKLSGWKDIFDRGFINVKYNEYSEKDFLLEAVSTYSSGYMGFFTETITKEDILLGTYIIYLTIKEGGKYEFSGYISPITNSPDNFIIDEISLETKTTAVVLVRTKDPSLVDTIRQIRAFDHQGCYFIMGDFLGTESILGLGATAGDWIVAQGPSWVKVTTTDRTIAGITGNVSAEDLASKLTGKLNNNLSLATKEEVVLIGNEDDSKDVDTYYGLKKYIETGKTALFCAGRIIGTGTSTVTYPYAKVEINDAFKAKYGDNAPSHTSVELANKRTNFDGSIRQLIASEHEGCYFVMDILEDNDNILGLNASYGDWVISQGSAWVKISTVGSNIAGFTGDVTDGQLANKLSQRSETNTTPLARQDELDDVIRGVKVNGESVDADENGVVDITLDAVQAVKINGEIKRPTEGIVDLGTIEGGNNDNTVVDFANDLTGRIEATPEEFTYRPSAGDKSVRDESAVIRRIKGNTIVWNNIVNITGENALVEVIPRGYRLTPNKTPATLGSPGWSSGWCRLCKKQDISASHKHLIIVTYTRVSRRNDMGDFTPDDVRLYWDAGGRKYNIQENVPTTIVLFGQPDPANQYITLNDCVVDVTDIVVCDLTLLFGEGNEPTTLSEFYAGTPSETDIFLYNYGEIIPARATGIETIGFNAFNGTYAEVIGGQAYYLGGAIDTAHFATEIGGEMTEITIPENRLYTPSENGYIYATGSNICINLSHSGVRNGEYEPYEKNTLLLPEIAKYFPEGIHGIGDVCDEINEEMAIQRCAVRAYEEGDENNAEVKTDKITTVYKLSEPIYIPIDEPLQLAYKVDDFGTEKMLSNAPSSPFKADIVYQFNAEGRIRDNARNIQKLEDKIHSLANTTSVGASPLVSDNINSLDELLPNVVYYHTQSALRLSIPPLKKGDSGVHNIWKVLSGGMNTAIQCQFEVNWKDGITPTIEGACFIELTFFEVNGNICGECKVYNQ